MNSLTLTLAGLALLTLLAVVLSATAFCLVRPLARSARKEGQTADHDLSPAVQAIRADLDSLAAQIRDSPTPQTLLAAPPRNGLNMTKRSQALRLNRRGTSPAQIAAALELPLQEVELLLKIDRIVVSNL